MAVIGASGSGKTTLARRLGEAWGLPHLELDAVYHRAGWRPLSADELRRHVTDFCAQPRWVLCGTYSVVRDIYLARADTVVCLDHNRLRQAVRVYLRSLRRVVTREELWNGNREPARALWPFGSADEVVARWAWQTVPRTRQVFDDLEARPPHPGLAVVRLRGWREVDAFVARATAHRVGHDG